MAAHSHSLIVLLNSQAEISDAAWLNALKFRHVESSKLARAAKHGDVQEFAAALPAAYDAECHLNKRERSRILESLSTLRTLGNSSGDAEPQDGSLTRCLFDPSLTQEELTRLVDAMIASHADVQPARETLVAAGWILRLLGNRLEAPTLLALLRWTIDRSRLDQVLPDGQEFPNLDPENGCDIWDHLELLTLHALCLPGLKGRRKLQQRLARLWQKSLDAITDTDGTPHSKWVPALFPRLSQLASITLFAGCLNVTLWDKKSEKRLEGLLSRAAVLLTPVHVSFSNFATTAASKVLVTAAEIFRAPLRPGLISLLNVWGNPARPPRSSGKIDRRFPKSNIQSDWAEWANLRSAWPGPVDSVGVRYAGKTPEVDVVIADLQLFAGNWSHKLKVGGESIPSTGEWSCCCWFLDKDAAFVELQLDRDNPVQVIRQAVLLRQENVLLLADSIRVPDRVGIAFKRQIPLSPGWAVEEDTLSRELQLVQGETRVRVFPWSSPQMRLHRSDESTQLRNNHLEVASKTDGNALYTATLLDWSAKRREEPIEWQRVTVVENGQYISPEVAVAHRLRLGKKQWVIYHSHQKPAYPRSTMGIHTLSETVFASLNSSGDASIQVEVEL